MRWRSDPSSLVRCYPRRWRERYGDEFAAFLDDSLAGRPPNLAFGASIVWAALREHARDSGLSGDVASPADRVRAGALLVLCAWTVYVMAGASFSKLSEQFDAAVPTASRAVPWGAFRAIQIVAVVAAGVVGTGAVAAMPAFWKFLRAGGWSVVSRHVHRATFATVLAVAASAGLVAWASSLSAAQRNGGDWAYGLMFVAWAILVAATLALWTVAAVAICRRLVFAPPVLALEAALAGVLTVAMVAITAATAIWWAAITTDAPWFLHGTAPGSPGSPFELRLAVTMAVMVGAVVAAGYGAVRAACSWRQLRAG